MVPAPEQIARTVETMLPLAAVYWPNIEPLELRHAVARAVLADYREREAAKRPADPGVDR